MQHGDEEDPDVAVRRDNERDEEVEDEQHDGVDS